MFDRSYSMKVGVFAASVIVFGLSVVTVFAGISREFTITATAGELAASQADGSMVWKVRLADSAVPSWKHWANGVVVLDNGMAIDESGRVLARLHGAQDRSGGRSGGGRGGSCPYWSALAEITPPEEPGQDNIHNPPLFDSQGNAWVVLAHKDGSDYSLQVRRSNRHDGTWQPLETISDSTDDVFAAKSTIDTDDNITIVFRSSETGEYRLYAMRYEPGVGWAGPDLVYTTSNFFQNIEVAADHDGNVVVAFDPQISHNTVWSTVYDGASGMWGPVQQVSPGGYETLLPTIVGNPAGDALYLIYMVEGGGPRGIYAHRFDSSAQTWGSAEMLPGSTSVTYSVAGSGCRFPGTVDRFGEATLFWQSGPVGYGVSASRTQNGVWQLAHELLEPGLYTDLEVFGHADASEFGDAFGVITRWEAEINRFYAFRYRADVGWDEPDNPWNTGWGTSTRVRVSFYRGANAVATAYGWQDGIDQLTSLLYNGVNWLPGLLDIPEAYPTFFQELEADQGEPLLILEAEVLVGDNYGIWASWLRNLPGDLDGDGDVDLSDLAQLLSNYGTTSGATYEDGDIDGDGDVDLSDLAALLAVYGTSCP